jgi:hypothetical protein
LDLVARNTLYIKKNSRASRTERLSEVGWAAQQEQQGQQGGETGRVHSLIQLQKTELVLRFKQKKRTTWPYVVLYKRHHNFWVSIPFKKDNKSSLVP